MAKTNNLAGMTFGRWTVIEKYGKDSRGSTMWLCECACGATGVIRHSSLTSGNSQSCGCLHKEITSSAHIKHGHYGERLYFVWNTMKQRCYNINNQKYADYGGRGIKVCKEWKSDYSAFREWAVKNGYDESAGINECTIDRIDVNGDYTPDNCRWVDAKTQANNVRRHGNQYTGSA